MVKPANYPSRSSHRSDSGEAVGGASRREGPLRRPRIFVKLSDRGHKIVSLVDGAEFEIVWLTGRNLRLLARGGAGRLVLVDALGLGAVAGWMASAGLRCPFVVRVRGDFVTEQKEIAAAEPPRARAVRLAKLQVALWLFRRATAVIFNSRYSRDSLQEFALGASHYVVENPVSIPREMVALAGGVTENGEESELRLLSLMNMNPYGKVMGLVRAIEWLGDRELPEAFGGRISWDIYGRGIFESLVSKAIVDAGLEGVVRFRGYADGVAEKLASCDVFVHFSNLDAFPNVTLEAMYFGKPVLTNAGSCGTLEQVEHGRNGLVVNGREELIRALLGYLGDPDLRKRHGAAGREIVREKFTPDVLRDRMGEVLRAILDNTARKKGDS